MKRKVPLVPNEYYHIFGRGNNKQDIFIDGGDYIRFLFLIIYIQSPACFYNLGRQVSFFKKYGMFKISNAEIDEILKNRYVEIINFTLMPNHFHLTVKELEDGGISKYMQRILGGFTKYRNTKYEKVGHLFQGPFKSTHIKDDNQLSYNSAYVHRNISELKKWVGKEGEYPWSSFKDYIGKNRWGKLLKNDIIIDRFESGSDYREFVENSGAKIKK